MILKYLPEVLDDFLSLDHKFWWRRDGPDEPDLYFYDGLGQNEGVGLSDTSRFYVHGNHYNLTKEQNRKKIND